MILVDDMNRARALARKALKALEADQPRKALRLAREAMEIAPDERSPRELQVAALRALGQAEEAESAARAALEVPLLGFHPPLLCALGELLLERGDAEEAWKVLRRGDHSPFEPALTWAAARASALSKRRAADTVLRIQHAVRANPEKRPRDLVDEPAFAYYWRSFIPQNTYLWIGGPKIASAERAARSTRLCAELLDLASEAAARDDEQTMYDMLAAAKPLDPSRAKERARRDPHVGKHWKQLRMKLLFPRSFLDLFG